MGPLSGIRILEFAGIGPGPMCAMLLADLGADVVRLERPGGEPNGINMPPGFNVLERSRRVVRVDLKAEADRAVVWQLLAGADALIEGFRPGTMERLGFGPDPCLARHPALVYGRMTGWGQTGPLAKAAGHDLNYIALSGALHAIGRRGQPPTPPLNLVGDFGGGALYLALGLVSALLHARATGIGQVVDAAMVDGAASLLSSFFGLRAAGLMEQERGTNLLDSGAFFYECYQCADGEWLSVAPIEAKFYRQLLSALNIDPDTMPPQLDRAGWEAGKATLAAKFATRTREEWCALLEGTDCCVAPVLTLDEAPRHRHAVARSAFVQVDGHTQPAPCPRFSRTELAPPHPAVPVSDPAALIAEWSRPGRNAA